MEIGLSQIDRCDRDGYFPCRWWKAAKSEDRLFFFFSILFPPLRQSALLACTSIVEGQTRRGNVPKKVIMPYDRRREIRRCVRI